MHQEIVKCRQQEFEQKFKITSLKNKLKKAKSDMENLQFENDELQRVRKEHQMQASIIEKLQKRDVLLNMKHSEIMIKMTSAINRLDDKFLDPQSLVDIKQLLSHYVSKLTHCSHKISFTNKNEYFDKKEKELIEKLEGFRQTQKEVVP